MTAAAARPFAPAWTRADAAARALLPAGWEDAACRAAAVAAAARRPPAPALVEALRRQHHGLPAAPARERALADLARPGAVVVVTGQQVGLFGGPLYALHKAATALRVAETLRAETGHPVVPVFWLQTEDHDRAEIDHIVLPRPDGTLERLALAAAAPAPARSPVGAQPLGLDIERLHQAMAASLAGRQHGEAIARLLADAYRPEATFAEAFRSLFDALFRDRGLLLLDPRDPALAALALPVHLWALEHAAALATALADRSQAIVAAGFAPQVHVRAGAPLSFVAPEGAPALAARYRIEAAGVGAEGATMWRAVGAEGRWSSAALAGLLTAEPLRASSSALLRPLVQDTLLPTAAMVMGPGEIAYAAQLAPLYQARGLPLPLVVPRARLLLRDGRVDGLLARLGLTMADATGSEDALRATRARAAAGDGFPPPAALRHQLGAAVAAPLAELAAAMARLDPLLPRSVERAEAQAGELFDKLIRRYEGALAHRDATAEDRLRLLRALVCPEGQPQERVLSLATFAAGVGAAALVEAVVAAASPDAGAVREVAL